jgi:hypothetical protein
MKTPNFRMLGISLLIAVTMTAMALAQSSDRDHPTTLKSNEITGDVDGTGGEYFYSFTAAPGELVITADAKGGADSGATIGFELFNQDGSKSLFSWEYAQADAASQSGRAVKKIKFAKRQTVMLCLTPQKTGQGTYRIKLSGSSAPNFDAAGDR